MPKAKGEGLGAADQEAGNLNPEGGSDGGAVVTSGPDTDAQPVETRKARVLVAYGALRCGDLVEGSEFDVGCLVAAGVADDHPDAVSYAAEHGAAVVQI